MAEPESNPLGNLRALVAVSDGVSRDRCVTLLERAGIAAAGLAEDASLRTAIREQVPDLVICEPSAAAALTDRITGHPSVRHARVVPLEDGDLEHPTQHPGQQLVDKIRAELEPRLALEAGLDSGEAVSGRIEQVGARALLEAVSRRRRDRRLTVWFERISFVVEFRGGELYALEASEAGADPCVGPAALEKLLLLDEAVFEVAPLTADPGRQFGHATRLEIEAAYRRIRQRGLAGERRPTAVTLTGGPQRGSGLRIVLVLVGLLVLGAGIFTGVRLFVFDDAGAGAHAEPGASPLAGADAERDAGPGGAASAEELRRLEEALRHGATAAQPQHGAAEGPPPDGAREIDAGAIAGETLAGDDPSSLDDPPAGRVTRPRPARGTRPAVPGAQTKPAAPKPGPANPPKKKGDPDVEAIIDDLGIEFE